MEELKVNISEEKELKVSVTDEEELKINVNSIDYIPGYKEAEEERRKNEAERQAYYEQVKSDIANGLFNISGGSTDYNELSNKPSIEGKELKGDVTLEELNIQPKGDYLTEEQDPTVPDHVKQITEENITKWNNGISSEDLTDYATKTYVDEAISENITTALEGSY